MVATLLLTSCTAVNGFFEGTPPTGVPTPIAEVAPSPQLQSYYSQPLSLSDCNGTFKCGNISVPLDYANPTGSEITIAVIFAEATSGTAKGTIFFNPGGPGSSGVQWVKDGYDQLGTANLRANYNVVGFDPRGVMGSSPVKCLSAKDTDKMLYGPLTAPLGSKADLANSINQAKKFAAACKKNSTKILPHVDTVSAARDIDILRAVFGDSKLNYLGYSYGTFLGMTYATLFANKVGHLVLDGVVDPTISNEQQSLGQLKGFDFELKAFLTDCLKHAKQVACPFKGNLASALKTVTSMLKYFETHSVRTSNRSRPLTLWGAETGMMMALYSKDYWQYLRAAFDQTLNSSDGSIFLALADFYNDRDASGTYSSNTLEANAAINCLDSRSSSAMADMVTQNRRLLKVSPTLGRYWQFGAIQCSVWPYKAITPPSSYAATGSAKILVVGTTGDPATPYSQAVHVANHVLENAQLVTWHGDGHTAYGHSNQCVSDAVDGYFIDSIVPAQDPQC
jgi:pimeloyl-ACP methyl ester carboxylesterase